MSPRSSPSIRLSSTTSCQRCGCEVARTAQTRAIARRSRRADDVLSPCEGATARLSAEKWRFSRPSRPGRRRCDRLDELALAFLGAVALGAPSANTARVFPRACAQRRDVVLEPIGSRDLVYGLVVGTARAALADAPPSLVLKAGSRRVARSPFSIRLSASRVPLGIREVADRTTRGRRWRRRRSRRDRSRGPHPLALAAAPPRAAAPPSSSGCRHRSCELAKLVDERRLTRSAAPVDEAVGEAGSWPPSPLPFLERRDRRVRILRPRPLLADRLAIIPSAFSTSSYAQRHIRASARSCCARRSIIRRPPRSRADPHAIERSSRRRAASAGPARSPRSRSLLPSRLRSSA